MTPEERKAFLDANRLCIVAYARKSGPPAATPVYYVMDGGDILISTQADRAKGRLDGREVTVCVLTEGEAMPRYLTVYGRASIQTEGAVDLMMRVGEKMTGTPVPESTRPVLEERAQRQHRVVLRIRPEAYVG
jgi:nitroimidazol reductase NimA-like FMN-containing flavoprotein (pyridoxamine 5'-phosphate oxidase superfamily)